MPDPTTCPHCGAALSRAGLCPACVRRVALVEEKWTPPTVEELAALLSADFKVEAFLGRGGMGAVYRATQLRLQRTVAIKIMRRDAGGDLDFAGRFQREAHTLAQLNHPGIVGVIDCGEAGADLLYLVMEYVEGADLMQVNRSRAVIAHVAQLWRVEVILGVIFTFNVAVLIGLAVFQPETFGRMLRKP